MRPLIFILVLTLLTFVSFGQDRKITLQIDTLVQNNYNNFSIGLTGQFFGNYPLIIEDSTYIKRTDSYPNLICPLTLKTDTTNIQISIDNGGGYILLIGAYQSIKDTLKINKVVVYNNCYNDTSFTRIDYFAYNQDSLTTKYLKSKFSWKPIKKNCKTSPLFETSYKINGVSYLVSTKIQDDQTEVTTFHGYKPKKYSRDPDNYKGKVTYFHGQTTTFKYINVTTLKLKNGT